MASESKRISMEYEKIVFLRVIHINIFLISIFCLDTHEL
jgi:hypothetical protein